MSDHTMAATILNTVLKTCGTCIWIDNNSNCACTTHTVTKDTVCDCPPEFGHYERRTCGNCDRYYSARPTMRQGMCPLDDLDEHGCAPIHNEDDEACNRWREIEIPPEQRCQQLEQQYEVVIAALLESEKRYQQLEQIAKSLLGIAHGAAEEIMFPSRELVANQRRKLEALGVNVDD